MTPRGQEALVAYRHALAVDAAHVALYALRARRRPSPTATRDAASAAVGLGLAVVAGTLLARAVRTGRRPEALVRVLLVTGLGVTTAGGTRSLIVSERRGPTSGSWREARQRSTVRARRAARRRPSGVASLYLVLGGAAVSGAYLAAASRAG